MEHCTSNSLGTEKQRIWYLDWLKLLAAVLVVFYHLAYYRLDYGFRPEEFYLPNGNRIIMSFAACSIPVFFMVNGALMFRRHRTWKEMLLKAAKILALILVWHIAQFPEWFFKTLFILYLLFPLIQYLKEQRPLLLKLLCGAVFLMPFCYNLMLMALKGAALCHLIPDWTRGMSATGCFTMYSILYFCLGPYLAERKPWSAVRTILCLAAGWVLVVGECVIYTNIDQSMYDAVNTAFPTIGALLMAAGLFMGFRLVHVPGENRLLPWAGDGVLAIYLLHMAFIRMLKPLLSVERFGLLTAAAGTIAVCLLCILIRKLFKKLPPLDWLLRI